MAISNATRLSDFGSGIGTQGFVLQIDDTNKRIGLGTDDPQSLLQVGVGCSISMSGVGTFADSVVVGSAFTANAQGITVVGTVTCTTLSGSGSGITGIATGVSINAAGGTNQKVMLANASSGVANTMANTSSLYWNDNTSTLYATNVNVSGTMTTEDVANTDAVGLVTAGLGLRSTKGGLIITAGVSTFTAAIDANSTSDFAGNVTVGSGATVGLAKSLSMSDNAFINFGTADDMQIYHDGSHSYIKDRGTGDLKLTGTVVAIEGTGETLAKFTDDGAAELYYDNSKKIETIGTGITVTGGVNASGLSTFYGGWSATGGGALKEQFNISTTALNSGLDINLDQGMVHYRSTNLGAASVKPNITSGVGINTNLKVGEAITVTIITAVNSTSNFVNAITVDHKDVTEFWVGGAAPTEGGGSNADAYTFNILKKGDADFLVIGNQNICSA